MNASHQRAELLYREAIVSVSSPGEYFGSAEYENLRRQAAAAFARLEVPLEVFFDVIAGRADGSRLAHPGIGAALSFPSRFLRKTSLNALPRPVQEAFDNLMHQNFFFGLVSHFSLNTFPTRSEVEKVDIALLLKEWFPSSLIANELMREYSKAANDLPLRIFEWYFERDASLFCKGRSILGFGEWRKQGHFSEIYTLLAPGSVCSLILLLVVRTFEFGRRLTGRCSRPPSGGG